MDRQNLKQALISLAIGLTVAVLSSVFDVLLEFIRAHGEDILAGTVATATYLAKQYRG